MQCTHKQPQLHVMPSSNTQGMVRRFVEDRELWVRAVEAVAELDALMSLAAHALNAEGSVCRPKLLPPAQAQAVRGPPVFEAKGLRHPSGVCVCVCVCVRARAHVGRGLILMRGCLITQGFRPSSSV
eukprot:1156580-Pelagomonas_calceolata.AAC.2